MSIIRPVEFPRIDSVSANNPGAISETSRKPGGNLPQDKINPGKDDLAPDKIKATKATQNSLDGQSVKNQTPSGVRFYDPKAVDVKNVPELGKHIDIRV